MSEKTNTEKIKNKNWIEIRKILHRCSESDLISIITELYTLHQSNKDFLEARFLKDNQALKRYKTKIEKNLDAHYPFNTSEYVNLKDAKKVISDYKKATNNTMGIIELMIHYVEIGTSVSNKNGGMYTAYYASLVSVLNTALALMKKFEQSEIQDFIERLKIIIRKSDDTGWGYYDHLLYLLKQNYPDENI